MARDYGQTKVTIWNDADFIALTSGAQRLFLYLTSQSKLDLSGVLIWRPRLAVKAATDLTEESVAAALAELESGFYVLHDEDTDELLVRSFIRNDELLKQPNLTKAMVKAWKSIDSETLRSVVAFEVNRLAQEDPSMRGLQHVDEVMAQPFIDPRNNPFGKGSPKGSGKGCRTTAPTPTPTPAPAHAAHPAFSEFWDTYPRKAEKKRAETAFAKAVKRVDAETILAGARRYRDDPNREDAFTKHAATWLNGDCWNDEPLPQRTRNTADQKLIVGAQRHQRLTNYQPKPDPFHVIQGELEP